jgi:hypothetical protein
VLKDHPQRELRVILRQLDGETLKQDMLLLADAPGPDALPGVKAVITAMTKLIATPHDR